MRDPNLGHTKRCLAATIIRVVSELRDMPDDVESDIGFALDMQDNPTFAAYEWLKDGTQECVCPEPATPPACRNREPEVHQAGEFPMTCYPCHIVADS
jgi:hypothetical protein